MVQIFIITIFNCHQVYIKKEQKTRHMKTFLTLLYGFSPCWTWFLFCNKSNLASTWPLINFHCESTCIECHVQLNSRMVIELMRRKIYISSPRRRRILFCTCFINIIVIIYAARAIIDCVRARIENLMNSQPKRSARGGKVSFVSLNLSKQIKKCKESCA